MNEINYKITNVDKYPFKYDKPSRKLFLKEYK